MKIKHIEKATFVDYPGKIACTIFLFGCSFRCGFCYNPSLVIQEETPDLQENDILDILKSRKGIIEAVCFTGGEPLLSIDTKFLEKVKSLDLKIKIDTNGSFPEKLQELIDKKLIDFIAMDIKAAKKDYKNTIGVDFPIEKIEKSIQIISNFPEYEFRTTILQNIHTKENFKEMVNWIKSLTNKEIPIFSLQGFKNNGNFVNNDYKKEPNTPENYLKELKEIAKTYCKQVNIKC